MGRDGEQGYQRYQLGPGPGLPHAAALDQQLGPGPGLPCHATSCRRTRGLPHAAALDHQRRVFTAFTVFSLNAMDWKTVASAGHWFPMFWFILIIILPS